MTIVLSISTGAEICIVADCRLSLLERTGQLATHGDSILARDICQKLFEIDGRAVVGWAGSLCLARDLLRGIIGRIRLDPRNAAQWLRSNNAILSWIKEGVRLHARKRAPARYQRNRIDHQTCQKQAVQLLIAWVDHERHFMGDAVPSDAPFLPNMEMIVVNWPEQTVSRSPIGMKVIGSGSPAINAIREGAYLDISWHGRDDEDGYIGRALMTASETAMALRRSGDLGVGGLFQIGVLSPRGSMVIPHFQLVPIREYGYGTYVAMRMEGGMWLQDHRPTRTTVKVLSPFDVPLLGPSWKQPQLFDPGSTLTADSPGMIQVVPGWVLEFCPYDPSNVYSAIRRSWGDEPLAQLTWAQGPPPKRWRRRGAYPRLNA